VACRASIMERANLAAVGNQLRRMHRRVVVPTEPDLRYYSVFTASPAGVTVNGLALNAYCTTLSRGSPRVPTPGKRRLGFHIGMLSGSIP
jgi:hypothetical protein